MNAVSRARRKGHALASAITISLGLLVGQAALAPAPAAAHMVCDPIQHRHWYSVYTWVPFRSTGRNIDWFTYTTNPRILAYYDTAIC